MHWIALSLLAGPTLVLAAPMEMIDCTSWGGSRATNAWTKCEVPKPTIERQIIIVPGPERIVYREVTAVSKPKPVIKRKPKHGRVCK